MPNPLRKFVAEAAARRAAEAAGGAADAARKGAAPGGRVPPVTPDEAALAAGLTQEAIDLVKKMRSEAAVPSQLTNNLLRIAEQNALEIVGKPTPQSIINALDAKYQAAVDAAPKGDAAPRARPQPLGEKAAPSAATLDADVSARVDEVLDGVVKGLTAKYGLDPGELDAILSSPSPDEAVYGEVLRAVDSALRRANVRLTGAQLGPVVDEARDRVLKYMRENTATLPPGQGEASLGRAEPSVRQPVREEFAGSPSRAELIRRSIEEQKARLPRKEYSPPEDPKLEMGPAGAMTPEQASSVAGRRPGNFNDMPQGGPGMPEVLPAGAALQGPTPGIAGGTQQTVFPAAGTVTNAPKPQSFSAPPPDPSTLAVSRVTRNSGPSLGVDEADLRSFGGELDITDDRGFNSVVQRRIDPATGDIKETLVGGDLVSVGDTFYFRDANSGQFYRFESLDKAPTAISREEYLRAAYQSGEKPQAVTQLTFPEDQGFRPRAYESSLDPFEIPELSDNDAFASFLRGALLQKDGPVNLSNIRRLAKELELRTVLDPSTTDKILGVVFGDPDAARAKLSDLRNLSDVAGRLPTPEAMVAPGQLRTAVVDGRQVLLDDAGMDQLNMQLAQVRQDISDLEELLPNAEGLKGLPPGDGTRFVIETSIDPLRLGRMRQGEGPVADLANRLMDGITNGDPESIGDVAREVQQQIASLRRTEAQIAGAFSGPEPVGAEDLGFRQRSMTPQESARFVRDQDGWRRLGPGESDEGLESVEVVDSPDMPPGDELASAEALSRGAPTPSVEPGLSQIKNLAKAAFTSRVKGAGPGFRQPTLFSDPEARPRASRIPSQSRIDEIREHLESLEDDYNAIPAENVKGKKEALTRLRQASFKYADEVAAAADSNLINADVGQSDIAAMSGLRQEVSPSELTKSPEEIYGTLLGLDEAAIRDQWSRLDPDRPEPPDITPQERMAREAIAARYTGENKAAQFAEELVTERFRPGAIDARRKARSNLESLQRQVAPLERMVDEGGGFLGSTRRFLTGSSVPYSPGALRQIGRALVSPLPGVKKSIANYDALMGRRADDVLGRIREMRSKISDAQRLADETGKSAFADPAGIQRSIEGSDRLSPAEMAQRGTEKERSPALAGLYKIADEIEQTRAAISASDDVPQELRDKAALAMLEIKRLEQQLNKPGFGGDTAAMSKELRDLRESISVSSGLNDGEPMPREFTLDKNTLEPRVDGPPAAPKPEPVGDLGGTTGYDFGETSMRLGTPEQFELDLDGRFKYFETAADAEAAAALLRGEMPTNLPADVNEALASMGVSVDYKMGQQRGLNPRFGETETGERMLRVDLPIRVDNPNLAASTGANARRVVTIEVPVMNELPTPDVGKTRVFRLDTEDGTVMPRVRDPDKIQSGLSRDAFDRSMFGMQLKTDGFGGAVDDPAAPDYSYEGTPFNYEDAPANRMPEPTQADASAEPSQRPRRVAFDEMIDKRLQRQDAILEKRRAGDQDFYDDLDEAEAARRADDPEAYGEEIDDPDGLEVARPTRSVEELKAEQDAILARQRRVENARTGKPDPSAPKRSPAARRILSLLPASAVVLGGAAYRPEDEGINEVGPATARDRIAERLRELRGVPSRRRIPAYGTTQLYTPNFN